MTNVTYEQELGDIQSLYKLSADAAATISDVQCESVPPHSCRARNRPGHGKAMKAMLSEGWISSDDVHCVMQTLANVARLPQEPAGQQHRDQELHVKC